VRNETGTERFSWFVLGGGKGRGFEEGKGRTKRSALSTWEREDRRRATPVLSGSRLGGESGRPGKLKGRDGGAGQIKKDRQERRRFGLLDLEEEIKEVYNDFSGLFVGFSDASKACVKTKGGDQM